QVLDSATATDSVAILATFAPDGPQQCSGLPTDRYGVADLAALLGDSWQLIADTREEHLTPAGALQPFTWATFRRRCNRPPPQPDKPDGQPHSSSDPSRR
ncbi:MAG: hypothetical protein ACRDNS_06270, partial [Trebonia sp.]